jgi:hypothetical protein
MFQRMGPMDWPRANLALCRRGLGTLRQFLRSVLPETEVRHLGMTDAIRGRTRRTTKVPFVTTNAVWSVEVPAAAAFRRSGQELLI